MTVRDIYRNLVVSTPTANNKIVSDIELMFIVEGNEQAKTLYKEFKVDLFNLCVKHARKLKDLLLEIKK